MTNRKFFKTTFTVDVLSEEPIPDWMTLQQVLDEADCGGYVAGVSTSEADTRVEKGLNGKEAADALHGLGSQPGFFQLDDEGNDE
jgi:hypothetical protein